MTEVKERQGWFDDEHVWLYEIYTMNTSMCRSLRPNTKEL